MRISNVICLVALSLTGVMYAEELDLDSLVRQLKHENAERREEAARAIGDLGPNAAPALPALVVALKDRDANVSVAAAYSIADIGPDAKDAVPALIASLSDTRKASWGSVHVGPATVDGAAWWALHQIGPHAAKSVAPFLKSKSWQHRAHAAWVISAAGKRAEPYVARIIALLDDENKGVRYSATDALGDITATPKATIPALTSALKSEDVNLRIRAAVSLSKHGNTASQAVGGLTELLRHEDSTLRGFAAYSLGRIGGAARPALPELRRLADDGDPVFNNLVSAHGLAGAVQEWADAAIQRIEGSKPRSTR